MPYCQTEHKEVSDPNPCVQKGHEVFVSKPNTLKFDFAHAINHLLVEPVIWVISAYGILVGILATYQFGFFTLKEYSFHSLFFFLTPNQVQKYDLWYQAYPYSLMIFGSYLILLYAKFLPQKKGFLALPVFMLTYAMWDFLGIGTHIIQGYSIIWLGIVALSLIYYFPIRNQFQINVSLIGLIIFFGFGLLDMQNVLLNYWPFTLIIIHNQPVINYLNGISNELTFCLLCLLSIKLKSK
jgi:hypothetical protein